MKKECPNGKILNPATMRCVSEKGVIGKAIVKGTYEKASKNPDKVKKVKKTECPPEKVLNLLTNRCVSKTGKIGMKILAEMKESKQKRAQKSEPILPKANQPKLRKNYKSPKSTVPKDIAILDFGIGRPINRDEAYKNFLCPRVVAKKQSLTSQGLFKDPITLQQLPLHDMIQLRESGEIMSKESFEDYYLNPNITEWCGKPNVGFKSPDGTLFGNLVLYNFDKRPDGFFPQKPGTLFIKLISRKKYFELTYRAESGQKLSFYIPNSANGIVLLCMMKDAFKKGNLFAFSQSGRIRHGRIHKKTSLTGIYGFPDDTYIERALAELNAIGSSPYAYQFSNDKSYEIGRDPYPEEKRWKIEYKG